MFPRSGRGTPMSHFFNTVATASAMLAPMLSLTTLTIIVPDLAAAQKFYSDLLGFTVATHHGPDLVELTHPGVTLILSRGETSTRPAYPHSAQVCPGFAVGDVDAEHARLRAAGADLVFAEPQPFPVGRFLAVRDPGGNVIELLQFNP